MTTTIHVYPTYVHASCKVQLIRRDRETGAETILADDAPAMQIRADHIWTGSDLIIREINKDPSP